VPLIRAVGQILCCCAVARRTCECNVTYACKTSSAFLVPIFVELKKADFLHRNPASAGAFCYVFMFSDAVKGAVCYVDM
jgi:hypothetical protein